MSKVKSFMGWDAFSLSDHKIYRWLEQQDDGWQELPEDAAFAQPKPTRMGKQLARINHKLRSLLPKQRRGSCKPA